MYTNLQLTRTKKLKSEPNKTDDGLNFNVAAAAAAATNKVNELFKVRNFTHALSLSHSHTHTHTHTHKMLEWQLCCAQASPRVCVYGNEGIPTSFHALGTDLTQPSKTTVF